ncbi:hypothetical protein ACIGFL_23200 [Pseudomonas sp. NPDC077649]|uniref:hypothetical protein n=1 Tax=Pseudomonas sp. NPDC077649 TaxID=3364423 RepID=UPI0037C7699C
MRVSLAMTPVAQRHRHPPSASPLRTRLGADRLNPLLTIILAFWALWHCRHARPPDAAPAC